MDNGFNTIEEIKAANSKSDWFSDAVVKNHGSKVETEVIGGYYFVESSYTFPGEPDSGRVYRAVAANPSGGQLQYLMGGDKFDTLDEARTVITDMIDKR